jgi:hypothetical protein
VGPIIPIPISMRAGIHGQPPLSAAEFTASRTSELDESRETRTHAASPAASALKSGEARRIDRIPAAARPVAVWSATAPEPTSTTRARDNSPWTVAPSIVVREKKAICREMTSSVFEIAFLPVSEMCPRRKIAPWTLVLSTFTD